MNHAGHASSRGPGRRALGALALSLALSPVLWGCGTGSAAGEPLSAGPPPSGTLEITYIGNEGFLIAAGEVKVLVDALYRDGVSGYLVHSPELRRLMESGSPPFDGVDLVLATHYHPDHFDAGAVAAFLNASPGALFVSTDQSLEKLRAEASFKTISDRARGIFPVEGDRVTVTHGGATATAINLHHGRGRPIQNLGFIIEVGGKKLLHMGDTAAGARDLAIYKLPGEKIDIGLLPYWFLTDPGMRPAVKRRIRARTLVPIHVPEEEAPDSYFAPQRTLEEMLSAIRTAWPGVVIFRKPMETRGF